MLTVRYFGARLKVMSDKYDVSSFVSKLLDSSFQGAISVKSIA